MPKKKKKRISYVYLQLIWNNLGVRPLRSTLTVVAISLQIVLILLMVGLTSGVFADWRARAQGVGADIIVQPPNSSIFFAFSSAVMQQSVGDRIAKLPRVAAVAPVLIVVDSRNFGVIYGIQYDRFTSLSDGFTFLSGGPFQAPNQAIADDLAAEGRHPGDPGTKRRPPGRRLFIRPQPFLIASRMRAGVIGSCSTRAPTAS